MSEVMEPMIHEDRLPGHESQLEPKPDWQPRYPGSGPAEGQGRADHRRRQRHRPRGRGACSPAKAPTSRSSICASMTMPPRPSEIVEEEGRRAITIAGDIGDKQFCESAVKQTVDQLGRLDILVNNAGEQHSDKDIRDITEDQLKRTFQTNIFGMFFLTQAALPHLEQGSAIINCTSETMYKGSPRLLDYSATKGAILGFTRSLAKNLVEKGIRVNARRAGADLDPAQPLRRAAAGEDPRVRQGHADGPAGPAERGRAVLPVPRLRGFELHDRPGASPRRRRHHLELSATVRFRTLCHQLRRELGISPTTAKSLRNLPCADSRTEK